MIVNPQVFNYRLTIGTLIIAFTALAAYSFTNYNTGKSNEDFLKQEKKLLESQISEIISSYDKLETLNETLVSKLDGATAKIEIVNDSLQQLKTQVSLIDNVRGELMNLKQQQHSLLKKGDSFVNANQELVKEKTFIANNLERQIQLNSILNTKNESLESAIEKSSLIRINSFEAAAYIMKSSGKIIEVDKASDTKNIRVAFVIAENLLASKQEKELYIQVIGPDNNIVADKGAVTFEESSLIYSSKINVDYNNKILEVCANIKTEEPLKEGRYFINVFEKDRRLGGTEIILH
jgi:hypothetical protein